jgi:exodeoxyribonuclease VII small subunit
MSESARPVLEDQSFGEALSELDRIVAELEGGQLELEESLSRYERGVILLRGLQAKLADAQQKVTMLIGEIEAESEEGGGDVPPGPAVDASPSPQGVTEEEVPF